MQKQTFALHTIPRSIEFMFAGFAVVTMPLLLALIFSGSKSLFNKAMAVPLAALIVGVGRFFFLASRAARLSLTGTVLEFSADPNNSWKTDTSEIIGYRHAGLSSGDLGLVLVTKNGELIIPVALRNEKQFLQQLSANHVLIREIEPITASQRRGQFSGKRVALLLIVGIILFAALTVWLIRLEDAANSVR